MGFVNPAIEDKMPKPKSYKPKSKQRKGAKLAGLLSENEREWLVGLKKKLQAK